MYDLHPLAIWGLDSLCSAWAKAHIFRVEWGHLASWVMSSVFSPFIKGTPVITILLNRGRMSTAPDLPTQNSWPFPEDQDGGLRNWQQQWPGLDPHGIGGRWTVWWLNQLLRIFHQITFADTHPCFEKHVSSRWFSCLLLLLKETWNLLQFLFPK